MSALSMLAKAGIPLVASATQSAVEAYLVQGKIDKAALLEFIQQTNPGLPLLLSALQSISADQAALTKDVLAIIREAIHLIGDTLPHDATPEERGEVRRHVMELVQQARQEVEKGRAFGWKMATGAFAVVGGVTVLGIGAFLYPRSPSTGRATVAQGLGILRGAIIG